MTKTLQPRSMRLVIDWFELEDDIYPDVGLPLGISVFVELQVEPDSVFTVMKGVEGVINFESTWYKGVRRIADRPPKTGVEDVEDQPSLETEEVDHFGTQGDLYSADGLGEGESIASSSKSSDTVRPSPVKPKPSKIPVCKSGTDGTFDDLDLELDIPPSPTLSSRDSLPWHSTKDTEDYSDDENGETEIDLDDLFTDLEDIYQPILRHENGDITLHAAREVEPGYYKVEIAFYRHFKRETQGWYGVDLCNVVKTCPPIPGKLVFNLQDHPSLITGIVGPDDLHDMEDGSREASFDPREEPYLAFWVWTHATYLEFWGEGEEDRTYYDDLIAPNAYLDSDELVEYVDFMFKTRDDEHEDDLVTEKIKTPEKVAQSSHYMSPITEEEVNDQIQDIVQEDITALNVDNVISGPKECPMTPISEEECESEEDVDVVWEDVPIPDVGNVECGPVEGSVSSSDEEELVNMVPGDVTAPNVEAVVSESEEASMTPFVEEEVDLEVKESTGSNVKNVTSTPEENSVMPIVEEKANNVIPENVTAPNIENVASESEQPSKLTTTEEEPPETSTPEDITAPNVDTPAPPPNNQPPTKNIEEKNLKSSGPYHPPSSPTLPTYAEALEGYENHHAMMAAQATFRRRALFCLHRVLPALFVLVFVVCACMNGPPVTISTPTSTLHAVRYYANHLGGMGCNALRNVNVPFADFGQYQHGWFEGSAALSEGGNEGEDFNDIMEYLVWKLVDGTMERAGISDSPAVFESLESTEKSVVSPSASRLDAELSPPSELAAEDSTPASESSSTTPDPVSDVAVPQANQEITSTLDHPTTTLPSETALSSLPIKEETPLSRVCPHRYRNPNTSYPSDCPPPPPPPSPALTILTGLAKDVFRHIACSTSPVCTISRISDKYEQPFAILARFQCDGKGDWEPETGRDGFDRFLGWVPDECKIAGLM